MVSRGQRRWVLAAVVSLCLGMSGCLAPGGCPHCGGRGVGSGQETWPPDAYAGSSSSAPTLVRSAYQPGMSANGGPAVLPNGSDYPGMPYRPGNGRGVTAGGVYPADSIIDAGPGHGGGFFPRELTPSSHPPYTVAPPDILFLDAIRLIPKPPYRVEPLEVLIINVSDTLPNQPITGQFVISPEGTINLGFNYGVVRVGGLTLDQIQTAIRTHLSQILRNPQVAVALAQFRGMQQIRGEHLVRPDGTISLGSYGCVYVAGMTLGQARCEIEKYLSNYLLNPQISLDVFAYNSKKIYVIVDGGGFGQQVFALPSTGNEYVLDAIASVQGLAPVSSKHRIWVARPSPVHLGCNQILPVDWRAITEGGSVITNYQLFPGDRVYVAADRLIAADNWLSKIFAPIERVLGLTFLGTNTVSSFQTINRGGGTTVIVP